METSLYRSVDTGMMLPVQQNDVPRCRDCHPLPPFLLLQALTRYPGWYCSTWTILPETDSHCPDVLAKEEPLSPANVILVSCSGSSRKPKWVPETDQAQEKHPQRGKMGFQERHRGFPILFKQDGLIELPVLTLRTCLSM